MVLCYFILPFPVLRLKPLIIRNKKNFWLAVKILLTTGPIQFSISGRIHIYFIHSLKIPLEVRAQYLVQQVVLQSNLKFLIYLEIKFWIHLYNEIIYSSIKLQVIRKIHTIHIHEEISFTSNFFISSIQHVNLDTRLQHNN